MNKILIDTNAYTQLLAGNKKVLHVISSAETVFMSIFVLGELFTGFSGGSKNKENRALLRQFLSKSSVKMLNATAETAEIFGLTKNTLKQAGIPLPINDTWIAAHGLETGSVIVTFDKHFCHIPGLRIWDEIH